MNQIHLSGAERVTPEEIESIIPVKGQRILGVVPGSIEKVIKNTYPVISDVKRGGRLAFLHVHPRQREGACLGLESG